MQEVEEKVEGREGNACSVIPSRAGIHEWASLFVPADLSSPRKRGSIRDCRARYSRAEGDGVPVRRHKAGGYLSVCLTKSRRPHTAPETAVPVNRTILASGEEPVSRPVSGETSVENSRAHRARPGSGCDVPSEVVVVWWDRRIETSGLAPPGAKSLSRIAVFIGRFIETKNPGREPGVFRFVPHCCGTDMPNPPPVDQA